MVAFNNYQDLPITDVNGMLIGRITLLTIACENWADGPAHFEIVPAVRFRDNETGETQIVSFTFKAKPSIM